MNIIKDKIRQTGRWFDNRKIAIGSAAVLAIAMVPMLIIAGYSHASADDFGWNAAMRRQLWNETHSLWQFIRLAVQNTVSMYYGWQGTFTTTFIQAFQPEIFNVKAYFIVPYIMMPFFFGGTALLLHFILVKMMKLSRSIFLTVTSLYLLVTIQYIPSTGEAFYWFNGAVAYTLAYVGVLFCLYFSLKFVFDGYKRNLAGAAVMAFFVGGGNYLTIVLLPLLLILVLFLFTGIRRRTLYLLLPLFIFGASAVFNMKAPGTVVRGGAGFGFDPEKAVVTIGKAVYNGLKGVLVDYLKNPVIVLCFILIALFLIAGMEGKEYEFSFKHPILFTGMTFGSYLAMYAPTYYAGVGKPFGRMCNLISFWFELSLILDIVYVTGYVLRVIGHMRGRNEKPLLLYKRFTALWDTYKIYIIGAVFLVIALNPKWYEMSATERSVKWLSSGEAAQFGREMDNRYALLLDDGIKDAVIEPLTVSAGPLFLYDVGENPEEWPNTAVAEFFNKDSVRMKKRGSGTR